MVAASCRLEMWWWEVVAELAAEFAEVDSLVVLLWKWWLSEVAVGPRVGLSLAEVAVRPLC